MVSVDKIIARSGFGMFPEGQLNVINKFTSECLKMHVGKCKGLVPIPKGFLLSIRSLKSVYNYIEIRNIKYILTSKLNQDCLENLFLQLRGLGHFYDNPSPTEV